jgi:hypothetical protein
MDKKKRNFWIFLAVVVALLIASYLGVRTDFWGLSLKPGSCLILPEKYCKTGVDFEEGSELVAYKLPDWAPVFAPFAGEIQDAGISNLSGRPQPGSFMEYFSNETASQSGGMNFFMTGDLRLKEKFGKSVDKGDRIARIALPKREVGGTGYNLLVSFGQYDGTIHLFVPTLETTRQVLGL